MLKSVNYSFEYLDSYTLQNVIKYLGKHIFTSHIVIGFELVTSELQMINYFKIPFAAKLYFALDQWYQYFNCSL